MNTDECSYHIEISAQMGTGIPQISADFGKITVLLGSNGTGKSRALKQIRTLNSSFGEPARPVVYIEGGRVITLPNAISYDFATFNEFGTFQRARQTFSSRRLSPMASRVRDAFYLLERRAVESKSQHSDAVTEWLKGNSIGECPRVEEDPLNRLFTMFTEVFPEIAIRLDGGENKQMTCVKNGQAYPITELSDGERQVLFILADIALTAEPNSLVLADEPELNLNPQLAERLWNTIETRLADAIFIYATHNISFAMRPSVDRVIALSGRGQPALQVTSVTDIDEPDVREFLGAIPAILAAQSAIVVEGNESSFDEKFYRWIMARPDIAIVPLGNCHEVNAATSRTGVWSKLAPSVRIVGIIDRDYREERSLVQYQGKCLVLDYHEAESYFCHPVLFCTIAKTLSTAEIIPNEEFITSLIIQHFEQNMLRIAANRMASRAHIHLNVSLQGSAFRNGTNENELRQMIRLEANKESSKAQDKIGADATLHIFDQELAQCRLILQSQDLDGILRLVPGKELLAKLAPRAGCKDTSALARAIYKHLDANSFDFLRCLRKKVNHSLLP